MKKLRRNEEGLSHRLVATLISVAIVVASLSVVIILLQKAPPVEVPPTAPIALQMTQHENLNVAENGAATLKLTLNVSTPALASVYRKAFEPENITPAEPVTFTLIHTSENDFLMGELENLTAEDDELKLSIMEGYWYHPSGIITSTELFFAPLIASATATWNAQVPEFTSLGVELSNDNGTTWEEVENGNPHTFTSYGSSLRYKVMFNTGYERYSYFTPTLYDITITLDYMPVVEDVIPADQMFAEGIRTEYDTILGWEAVVTNFEKTLAGPENQFSATLDLFLPQAAKFDAEAGIWKIDIGHRDENKRAAAIGHMVTQMMFIQQMLESLPEENVFEYTLSTPIVLPKGATIVNPDELSGLSWYVDFGGGTYRQASVAVNETLRMVTLTEKIVVTKQPLTVSPENFLENLSSYRVFTIRYTLGAGRRGPGLSLNQPASGGGSSNNWSKTWTKTISYTFSKTFSWSGTYGGASASASAAVSATPSLTVKLYIGWSFSWFKLKWFRTYFEVTPSATVNFSANVTGGVSKEWSYTYNAYSHTFNFWIGPVPVWADLELDVIPGVDVSANATCTLSAGVGVSATGKFGVEWIRGTGWRGIKELSKSFWRTGPTITGSADLTITPYVKLQLGFYLYSVAGPYAYIKPKVQLQALYPERTWSVKTGFDINAGVGMGKLGRWVGLSSWEPSTPLYSWLTTLWSGTW